MTSPALPVTPASGVETDVATPGQPAVAGRRTVPWAALAIGVVVAAGIAARFVANSHLWLDEALSVNIAGVPLKHLPETLKRDGSPPLYYVFLHGWIRLFGAGTIAVRAFSGVCSVACLPLAWRVGRRLGGRTAATAVLVLLALSPFAVQYATEVRMYSMAMLIVLAGGLALANLLERPSLWLSAGVALATGALLLTHYYALYSVAVVGAVLLWHAVRGEERAAARRALAATVAGSLLFLPWVPSFLVQLRHTGTPWSGQQGLSSLPAALGAWDGGSGVQAWLFGLLLVLLAVVGTFAVAAPRGPGARIRPGRAPDPGPSAA